MSQPTPDPFTDQARAAYAEDQADAATRDQVGWDMTVRSSAAQASLTEAHAFSITARAILLKQAADAIALARILVTAAAVVRLVRAVRR